MCARARAARASRCCSSRKARTDPLYTIDFKGIAHDRYRSAASGRDEIRWLGKPVTQKMPVRQRSGSAGDLAQGVVGEANLVRGTSIGFRPLDWKALPSSGRNYTRWAWHELSAVTVPCNQECTIETIKALDRQYVMRATRVVWIDRPVSRAVEAELNRQLTEKADVDVMLAQTLGTAEKTTNDCLQQLDTRIAAIEAIMPTKALAAMSPDEFFAHRRALRRIGAA